jgi:PilZ domain
MTDERRRHKRVTLRLPVKWDALSGAYEARIDDISLSGCFVNTPGRVEMNEIVSLEVQLPSSEWLALRGEVKSYQPGIGFGILFTFLTEDEESTLRELIEQH